MVDRHVCTWDGAIHALVPKGNLLSATLEDGDTVTIRISHERRLRHHNFYFKCMSILYVGWPEDHMFNPKSAEMLRKYLQCRAGWGDTTICEDLDSLAAVFTAAWGKEPIVEKLGGKFHVHIPKSVKFNKMDQAEFHDMVNAIEELLYNEIGYGFTELKLSMLEDDHHGIGGFDAAE